MEEIENLCRICMADYEESTSLYEIVDKNKISETNAGIMFIKCLNLEVRVFFHYLYFLYFIKLFYFRFYQIVDILKKYVITVIYNLVFFSIL